MLGTSARAFWFATAASVHTAAQRRTEHSATPRSQPSRRHASHARAGDATILAHRPSSPSSPARRLYHASHFCINKTATSLKAADRATLALKVVNIVHAAISGPVAFYFLFLDGDAATAHAVQRAIALDAEFAPSLFSAHMAADQALALTCWTVGFMVWDLYRIDTWAKSGHGERKLLIVHHVLSILVWPPASSV